MKERLVLFMIVFGLGVFIYIFQSYFNTLWGLLFLVTAMTIYAIFTTLAYKLKKRQLQKHPKIINENYKPFVSIMIPCHNEASVIENTVTNILNIDYEKFEIIVIDDRSTDNTPLVVKNLENKFVFFNKN